MSKDPDEDALSWSGETDPTHVAAPAKAKPQLAGTLDDRAEAANPVLLVVMGILAGVYLLYMVGWILFGFSTRVPVQGVFFAIMYQVGVALAIASPFLWAAATWLRVKNAALRLLWLFVGVLVLAPWPFIVGGLG
jgi:hypothetical protein